MSWYYAENDQQIGPVDDTKWQSLLNEGKIQPGTLVWKEGMESWVPYSQVAQTASPSPAAAAMAAPASGTGAAPAPAASAQDVPTCSECGGRFREDELIEIEGRRVCGNCKPLVVQKLKEGSLAPTTLSYAGFWIRAGAKIVDGIIVYVVNMALGFVVGMGLGTLGEDAGGPVAVVLLTLIQLAIGLAYYVWFLGKYSATPGKMACGLKVVTSDGGPITYGRATGRFFAEWLSAIILYIGYLMVAWDEEKRALHDRVCDTRVVRN